MHISLLSLTGKTWFSPLFSYLNKVHRPDDLFALIQSTNKFTSKQVYLTVHQTWVNHACTEIPSFDTIVERQIPCHICILNDTRIWERSGYFHRYVAGFELESFSSENEFSCWMLFRRGLAILCELGWTRTMSQFRDEGHVSGCFWWFALLLLWPQALHKWRKRGSVSSRL